MKEHIARISIVFSSGDSSPPCMHRNGLFMTCHVHQKPRHEPALDTRIDQHDVKRKEEIQGNDVYTMTKRDAGPHRCTGLTGRASLTAL